MRITHGVMLVLSEDGSVRFKRAVEEKSRKRVEKEGQGKDIGKVGYG